MNLLKNFTPKQKPPTVRLSTWYFNFIKPIVRKYNTNFHPVQAYRCESEESQQPLGQVYCEVLTASQLALL
ncbi:hypothetical protein DPMN_057089 [Dreissena polymorpha]|uniref:Uncharacterized protein n=1 Tax=Dreissena polymorpha TaxID=45954 RepID=A0A9D4CUM7_DREPO|nr:hypothetical protein DPMN_057089 [Dreissena polymorpha]